MRVCLFLQYAQVNAPAHLAGAHPHALPHTHPHAHAERRLGALEVSCIIGLPYTHEDTSIVLGEKLMMHPQVPREKAGNTVCRSPFARSHPLLLPLCKVVLK